MLCPVLPVEMVFSDLVNATAVTVSWAASSLFSTWLQYISSYTTTGAIMSQYETLLPPGVGSTDVALEDDITLDESKEDIQHIFTLQYIVTLDDPNTHGPITTNEFTFGMNCHVYVYMSYLKTILFYR